MYFHQIEYLKPIHPEKNHQPNACDCVYYHYLAELTNNLWISWYNDCCFLFAKSYLEFHLYTVEIWFVLFQPSSAELQLLWLAFDRFSKQFVHSHRVPKYCATYCHIEHIW